jgi:hypothetical protein
VVATYRQREENNMNYDDVLNDDCSSDNEGCSHVSFLSRALLFRPTLIFWYIGWLIRGWWIAANLWYAKRKVEKAAKA